MERKLAKKDSERIKCQRNRFGNPDCNNQATISNTVNWNTGNTKGTSFFYFCKDCNKALKKANV